MTDHARLLWASEWAGIVPDSILLELRQLVVHWLDEFGIDTNQKFFDMDVNDFVLHILAITKGNN